MLNFIKNFRRDEDGAVTVDWVVLTAAIVALGLVVGSSVRTGPGVAGFVALMATAAGVGVMLPESATGFIGSALNWVSARVPLIGNFAIVEIFKAGHFFVFFGLGLLVFRFRGRLGLSRMRVIALLLLLAIASEGAQLYFHNRTTRFTDVIVDSAGILLAAALVGNRQRRRLPS